MPPLQDHVPSSSFDNQDISAVANFFDVNPEIGLDTKQVVERTEKYGPNEIITNEARSHWHILLAQFSDFMILVLIAAAIISGLLGETQDTIAIVVIILLNAVIGFVQDFRAERALQALRQLAAPMATVRRDGDVLEIPADELVPGDVVVLHDGDLIPADIRLTNLIQLQTNEAALTGESQPVDKTIRALDKQDLSIADKINIAYKGTVVTQGRAEGIAIGTGMQTEIGKIASLLSKQRNNQTPLQKRLARFGKRLTILILLICTLIFIAGLLQGESVALMFLTAVSLAVAAIPEALPAVITISLALGARKMVRMHALIRNLPAVETLGSVTYICSDKTGTLTENSMRLEVLYCDQQHHKAISADDNELWQLIQQLLALSNNVYENHDQELKGDPTEVAMYAASKQLGYNKALCEKVLPRISELAFDAERRRMTTIHQQDNAYLSFTKGAAESVLDTCESVLTMQGIAKIDKTELLAQAEQLAHQGYRVLGLAYRSWQHLPEYIQPDSVEKDLVFLGFVGLIDPPRAEAHDAVKLCQKAGITPIMITGDHPATALAIAKRLGITEHDGECVMTGNQLEELSHSEFQQRVEQIRVYARVSPGQKIKIVRALQDNDQFVAMTGDGVNDAPALKRADIGVAMGQKGTDVAREASSLVLLDDNFATIVKAVREGRRIFDNIRKFIKYTLTSNSGEIWTLLLAPYLGLPIPLLPIHILWINLVTDGLPGLALVAETSERGIMHRPPRPPNESIFAHGLWQHMIWVGLLIGGVSLASQAIYYFNGSDVWQTMVFTTLTLAQLVHVLVIRSERESLFSMGVLSNRYLIGAIVLTILLQLAVIYVPWLQTIFKTQALSITELSVCFALAGVILVAVETEKWFVRNKGLYGNSIRVKQA
jgi:Ca2+-transporting ATPase